MVTLTAFLLIYVLGGLTFIPLVLVAVLCHAYFTFPLHQLTETPESIKTPQELGSIGDDSLPSQLANLPEELRTSAHEPDVAAGYFAVCREYVPGGVNGKPPERTTPAGAVIAAESPSVYQSMYRSIFDRNKTISPTIDGGRASAKTAKRARNVFFVVLRHGHLMLYDDSEQLEVRHVISLAHHTIDIYSGGNRIPEGELWIKRNCIRLMRKPTMGDISSHSKPFYLFSENCSEKEDFYHALLRNQEQDPISLYNPPLPQSFETAHIVKLVQQLHASEENLQTRWINAIIGRLFLAMYKTSAVEDFIRTKITKKIARVPKPAFISSMRIQRIDMGDSAPFITNPKLKELTIDGDLTIEADVKYKGHFRIEIAAVARIELGSRIKAREVDLILAGILKGLEGHILIRIKPPPSNRLWISFETMPLVEMSIEPIVSSRQITYGIVLRAIESRIREVIGETLVFPNWDDIPFYETMGHQFRGGIWKEEAGVEGVLNQLTETAQHGERSFDHVDEDSGTDGLGHPGVVEPGPKEKSRGLPSMMNTPSSSMLSRKAARSIISSGDDGDRASSSAIDVGSHSKLRAIRSGSFSNTPSASVTLDPATIQVLNNRADKERQDATTAMNDITSRSPSTSALESQMVPPGRTDPKDEPAPEADEGESSSASSHHSASSVSYHSPVLRSPDLASSTHGSSSSAAENISVSNNPFLANDYNTKREDVLAHANPRATPQYDKRQTLNHSLTAATAAAKRWFANRNSNTSLPSSIQSPSTSSMDLHTSPPIPRDESTCTPATLGSPGYPIGRGYPLPPPGQPLPPPQKPEKSGLGAWSGSPLASLTRRKPVPQATQPQAAALSPGPISVSPNTGQSGVQAHIKAPRSRTAALGVSARHDRLSNTTTDLPEEATGDADDLLVVEAPMADFSTPVTPTEGVSMETYMGSNTESLEDNESSASSAGSSGLRRTLDKLEDTDRVEAGVPETEAFTAPPTS